MGVFIRFYRVDPIDMTWGRFYSLINVMEKVEREFAPKSTIDLALMKKEDEIRRYYEEHPDVAQRQARGS